MLQTQVKTPVKEQVRAWGRGREHGRGDGCGLGTRERGLLVGGGHSGLALPVNGMGKLREGTADTRKRKEEALREDEGLGCRGAGVRDAPRAWLQRY